MEINYREYDHRIFVNRNVYMYNIQCFGFDLDYTLAEYNSSNIHSLIYNMARNNLVDMGYPEDLKSIPYDAAKTIRGLIFDKTYGNFLKMDPYGMILVGVHGYTSLTKNDIIKYYPSRFIDIRNTTRFVIYNTTFDIPETFLLSSLIWFFDHTKERLGWRVEEKGINYGFTEITYLTMYNDVHNVVKKCHKNQTLNFIIADDLDSYIYKRFETILLLHRLKKQGLKTFLLSNNDFWYTNQVMQYLFKWPPEKLEDDMSIEWRDYFDIVIVNAKKPLFFHEGTLLKQVNPKTGKSYLGSYVGKLTKGCVYQGGNSAILSRMLKSKGNHIMYVGDHIYVDILQSKKQQGWRTFLVVPELRQEISVWRTKKEFFDSIQDLEAQMASLFIKNDCKSKNTLNVNSISMDIKDAVSKLETCYGHLGSMMRCGSHLTFFASQISRFADLYAYSCCNLIYYPFDFFYRTPFSLMPHETTVRQIITKDGDKVDSGGSDDEELLQQPLDSGYNTTGRTSLHFIDEDFEVAFSNSSEKPRCQSTSSNPTLN